MKKFSNKRSKILEAMLSKSNFYAGLEHILKLKGEFIKAREMKAVQKGIQMAIDALDNTTQLV